MTVFVNPYTWSPNELVTATKLNYLGAYLTTYLNGSNISPSQLSAPYSNQMMMHTQHRMPPTTLTFLSAVEAVSFPLSFPATDWNFVVSKVAITCLLMAGTTPSVKFDIRDSAFASVLVGPAPVAVASNVEVANNNSFTMTSGSKYYMYLEYFGSAANDQAYGGVCAVVYGKMYLRS